MKRPITLFVVGAGGRGRVYAEFAHRNPDRAKVVAVAEPDEENRSFFVDRYQVSPFRTFQNWEDAVNEPRLADAVIIATQDKMHAAPAVAFAEKGYAILLEKPMAPTEEECSKIVDAVIKNQVIFAVCHVLRYTKYTTMLREMITNGEIGEVVSIQHLEPVGYWHQAHSFVRGNWRNEEESSSMLLAKSCHDLDWIRFIIGEECESVSSFGSLYHFRKEQQPTGATDRCLDCPVESDCAYSAIKIYLTPVDNGYLEWPINVLSIYPTHESILKALKEGPYGRCVYACDNNVVDHQVVNMKFRSGKTAVFTMTAFTEMAHRKTRIFGTKGQIYGDGVDIEIYKFLTGEEEKVSTLSLDGSILGGHGGGDNALMDRFITALEHDDESIILSGARESLETHKMVFAAEKSRKTKTIVDL